MWYRIAQLNGITQNNPLDGYASELGIVPEKFYPELTDVLKEIGMSAEHYNDLPVHAKKSIWDIIVHKLDRNTYNPFEDSDTPGFDAEQARRHSPYHTNPSETTLEEQLEATRHDTIDSVPNNMQQAEKGRGGMELLNGNGAPQYASGKGGRLFYDNLPSNITLV